MCEKIYGMYKFIKVQIKTGKKPLNNTLKVKVLTSVIKVDQISLKN